MSGKRIIYRFVFILFFLPASAFASAFFKFTDNCKSAQDAIFALNFTEAKKFIQSERALAPDNVAPDLMDNLADCISLFISENETDYKRLKPGLERNLKRIELLTPESPYYLFGKSMILLQWAGIRIKFGEYYTTAFQIHKAYSMLEENEKKFPDFIPDKPYIGFLHAIVGSVPDQYKWLSAIAGFHGSISQGAAEINMAKSINDKNESAWIKKEAAILSVFLELNFQRNSKEARRIALSLYDVDKGPLISFLLADISLRSGDNETALNVLTDLSNSHQVYFFPYLDYLKGLACLNAQRTDANIFFEKFLSDFKGRNYIKAAHQKLAWYYLLNNNLNSYKQRMSAVLLSGNEFIDEDKQAQLEAKTGEIPNTVLLKSRLLCDGGYYDKALSQFKGTGIANFPTLKNQLEVTYRVGRIYHKQNEIPSAIKYYEETLKNGSAFEYYFAANSALQLALIYEEQSDTTKAEQYFKKCLSLRNHEYQNSIDQKAKAGLNRIGKGH